MLFPSSPCQVLFRAVCDPLFGAGTLKHIAAPSAGTKNSLNTPSPHVLIHFFVRVLAERIVSCDLLVWEASKASTDEMPHFTEREIFPSSLLVLFSLDSGAASANLHQCGSTWELGVGGTQADILRFSAMHLHIQKYITLAGIAKPSLAC